MQDNDKLTESLLNFEGHIHDHQSFNVINSLWSSLCQVKGTVAQVFYYGHSQEVLAKFGYRSERQVENVRELAMF